MSDSLLHRITINAEIAHGKPTIRNKRYTVEGMLEYLAAGDSFSNEQGSLFVQLLYEKHRLVAGRRKLRQHQYEGLS